MALVRDVAGSAQPDLFSPSDDGAALQDYLQAWELWVGEEKACDRLRRASSEAVYEDVWNAFAAWAVASRPVVSLDRLGAEDLERFLLSRSGDRGELVSLRHAARMMSLIDRVMGRWARERGKPRSTAVDDLLRLRPDIRRAHQADAPLPDYLDATEARQLVVFLSEVRPRSQGTSSPRRWQDVRNRASVALMLGGGLTPGEARCLPTTALVSAGGRLKDVPWKIAIPADGPRPERETPLAPWAGQLLRYWLELRATLGFLTPNGACAQLFPSSLRGGVWSKVGHWQAVNEVFESAGIVPAQGGSFRLRHTFAVRQIRAGKPLADVARWMGIVNVGELERYRHIIPVPLDVV